MPRAAYRCIGRVAARAWPGREVPDVKETGFFNLPGDGRVPVTAASLTGPGHWWPGPRPIAQNGHSQELVPACTHLTKEKEVTPCSMHLPTRNSAPGTLHGQTPRRPGTQPSTADALGVLLNAPPRPSSRPRRPHSSSSTPSSLPARSATDPATPVPGQLAGITPPRCPVFGRAPPRNLAVDSDHSPTAARNSLV